MKTQMTYAECPIKIKVGDVISGDTKYGNVWKHEIARIEEKSWYPKRGGRNSYGTLVELSKCKGFRIN